MAYIQTVNANSDITGHVCLVDQTNVGWRDTTDNWTCSDVKNMKNSKQNKLNRACTDRVLFGCLNEDS